jgi:hypothetical protein
MHAAPRSFPAVPTTAGPGGTATGPDNRCRGPGNPAPAGTATVPVPVPVPVLFLPRVPLRAGAHVALATSAVCDVLDVDRTHGQEQVELRGLSDRDRWCACGPLVRTAATSVAASATAGGSRARRLPRVSGGRRDRRDRTAEGPATRPPRAGSGRGRP